MIAQLKQSLSQNAAFEKRCSEKPMAEQSIRDRLKALTDSANLWQQKTQKPVLPLFRRKSSAALKEIQLGKNAASEPSSIDISSGLNTFFKATHSCSQTHYEPEHVDLDAISNAVTPLLTAPRRPRGPNRKRSGLQSDSRTKLEAVKINESNFVEPVKDHEKIETQEAAIAVLKNAKTLLKSPTKKSDYPEVMLIQIRGSKHVDVRLVAPKMTSIHENACFILVHHKNLLKYEGVYSNILEKTKTTQLCIEITGKADLNCTVETATHVNEYQKHMLQRFLSNSENEPTTSKPIEDNNNAMDFGGYEPFENVAAKLNLVFRIANDKSAQACSRSERLSIAILQPDETLIFDFGTEIYVWSGRNSNKLTTAYATEYAKQLINKPLKSAKAVIGEDELDRRPDWILFRKLHQGVLDTLFKAKFSDWKDEEGPMTTCRPQPLFKIKEESIAVDKSNDDVESEELAEKLRSETSLEPLMILEDQEIDRRMQDVVPEDMSLWYLSGEVLTPVEFTSTFLSTRCYVLKWQYRIQKSGIRRITTGKAEERETGRSRMAFFYWLGERTTPKQHGLCALRIKDIDKENSPRIRVVQGNEPALFLALFQGKFVVRCDSTVKPKKLFVVTGANTSEVSLREIDDESQKLRSHAVYVEENEAETTLICGAFSSRTQVQLALSAVGGEPKIEVEGDSQRKWVNSEGRERSMRVWRIFENKAEMVEHLSGHADCSFTFDARILADDMMLIDVGGALWLWTPEVVTTFALKLADKYWKGRNGPARVIYRNGEPEAFKALFQKWEETEEKGPDAQNLRKLLSERCRHFTVKELRERTNLPAGMNLKRLESYLSDTDFQEVFQMSRTEFYAMKAWKQNEARKKVGLF
ncbi:unnamed protein product [Caenorhabditis bovis]|uniref:HP domain-containing protein n=1 Tax=Caenorhabditis bovis TaxID=2654633 RepID=A0A8S1F3F5_9PELO|nr:unnamed protein product [Caenorhabditis bovis]